VNPWAAPTLDRAERWLAGRRALVLLALLSLAALVRFAYFVELSDSPYLRQHVWDQTDMHFFDEWGRRLAAGDWIGRAPFHPRHTWQLDLARAELAARPELAASLGARAGEPDAAAGALVDRWYGGAAYHQEPLYPWLVGLTYAVLGPDVRFVFAWQLVVGALATGLVYLVARRAFGDLVGALAGVLALLCGTLVYYEMLLLRESLLVATSLLLVLWLTPAGRPHGTRFFFGLGVASGLALLLKTSLALWLVPALAVRCSVGRRDVREAASRFAAALAGVALALAPVVARNVTVGTPALALSGVGAMTYVNANAEDFPGDVGAFVSRHAGPILTDAGGRFLPSAIAALRTHPGPGSYARQLGRKLAAVCHWYEIPNNANFYAYRMAAPVLGLPVTFLVVAPPAVIGLFFGWRRPFAWPLCLMVCGNVATMLVFYPLSRFRAPLLAGLLPFASLAIVGVVDLAATGRRVQAVLVALAVAAVGLWVGRPLLPGRSLLRAVDCQVPLALVYAPAYRDAAARGEWRSAAEVALRAVALEPPSVRRLGAGAPAATPDDRACALAFGGFFGLMADAFERAGEPRAAEIARRRADALAQAAGPAGR
jgi:4-amino-4-deoxy-L-arabinose transferase-like glycosyltransferase